MSYDPIRHFPHQQQIQSCEESWQMAVMIGKLRKIDAAVKSLTMENKAIAALCIIATDGHLGFLPTAMMDGMMTEINVAATPKLDISILPHFKAFEDIVAKSDEELKYMRTTANVLCI